MGLFRKKKEEYNQTMKEMLNSGRYDELIDYIDKSLTSGRMVPQKLAIEYVKKVLEIHETPKAHYVLSNLLIPSKEGLEHAKKAFEAEPTNKDYAIALSMYYSEGMKNNESAMAVYERYWEASGDVDFGLSVADWYLRKGDTAKAKTICKKILLKEPDNKKAMKILKKIDTL